MTGIGITIIIPILTAVVGAVVGVLFQNLLFPGNGQSIVLSFNEINVEEKQVVKEKEIIKEREIIREKANSTGSTGSDDSIWLFLLGALFIGLLLIWLYLKYQNQIFYGLLISSLFIISICLSAICFIVRKKITIDSKFKTIITWIVISTIFIPIEIHLLQNPLYFNTLDKTAILEAMNKDGWASILNNGSNAFGFLLYQAIAIIILILFIAHLLDGNIHIWAMINLKLNSKLRKLWKFLFNITYPFAKNLSGYIGFSVLLLIISMLSASGIIAGLLSR